MMRRILLRTAKAVVAPAAAGVLVLAQPLGAVATTTAAPTAPTAPVAVASAKARPNILVRGASLTAAHVLPAATFRLAMQGDGNLVLYRGGRLVWQTGTANHPGAHLVVQADGNVVLYARDGRVLRNWRLNGRGTTHLAAQGDGNLVAYAGVRPVWDLKSARARAAAATLVRATDPHAVAARLVARRGWSTAQYGCLVNLWNRESGWNVRAGSAAGAYGIPQAVPGSKMAAAGADWRTSASTQITWGLAYIAGTYGTPCGAWAHSQATGWY